MFKIMDFISLPSRVFEAFYKARFVDHKRFSSVVYEGIVYNATFWDDVVSISSYHQSLNKK